MKLPHHDDVQIDIRKVRDYLLSPVHPVGRFKARVFKALGFDVATTDAFGDHGSPEVHCSWRAQGFH